jgi:hypothetical protein
MPLPKSTPRPKPDFNQPRYVNAVAAIDDVNNLARQDIVYDQWPIDDPYRDTALCAVQSIYTVGNVDLNKMLDTLPIEEKHNLIDTMAAVVELKVEHINSAYDNVYVIGSDSLDFESKGKEVPYIENPLKERHFIPRMTPYEQIQTIATNAHLIAHNWANRQDEGLGVEERVMGAVHGVLGMFQNGFNDQVPAFQLIPLDPETDRGCINQVYRDGVPTDADWNYGQPMGLTYKSTSYADDPSSPPGSLTCRFEEQYENTRGRFRTAAQDLFGHGGY